MIHRSTQLRCRSRARHRTQAGAVSAEAAVVIPTLVLIAVALVWLIGLVGAQIMATDAAREAARGLARGDGELAIQVAQQVAPTGAQITWSRDGESITVVVKASARALAPGLGFLPRPTVQARAVALTEPGVTDGT